MITEELARSEFDRLSELDGFHLLKPEAVKDYIWAVQTADTPDIAHRIIDDIKAEDSREQMPTSAYIRGRMNDENERLAPHEPTMSEKLAQWKAEFEAEQPTVSEKEEIRDLQRWVHLQAMVMSRKPMSPALQQEHAALRAKLRARHNSEYERKPVQKAVIWHAELQRVK